MEVDAVQYIFGSFSRRRPQAEDSATPKRRSLRKTRTTEFVCGLCEQAFCEPRVLPCLHSFCSACLQQLHVTDAGEKPLRSEVRNPTRASQEGSQTVSRDALVADSSSGSGYESDCGGGAGVLPCPTCGARNPLPAGGIEALPPDYVVQHRMVLASLNQESTSAHARQRGTAGHEVLGMREARQRGITQVRRQAMCPTHPDLELQLFCVPCGQVACRECCHLEHKGHNCDPAPRAARALTRNLKDGLERARPLAEEAVVGLDSMRHLERKIQTRCEEVTKEVDRYIDSYIEALEEHRRSLHRQVREAGGTKLRRVRSCQRDLERCAEDTRAAIGFAEDLLAEASDIELLSLVMPVLQRLEWCMAKAEAPRVSECLQFLPHESAGKAGEHALFGVVTTQTLSHQHCTLDAERSCVNCRKVAVQVTDRRDGTYGIAFVPDVSGNLSLHVSVQGKPVQGSPFQVCVRMIRPHRGMFHCCSFCSSGGSKEATCGCGGKMPELGVRALHAFQLPVHPVMIDVQQHSANHRKDIMLDTVAKLWRHASFLAS
ncbi:hypothetical protein C0J52_02627 [Blattella germanica]|nr:hypothetical protein C0J52_02627 [Blattella germanica]